MAKSRAAERRRCGRALGGALVCGMREVGLARLEDESVFHVSLENAFDFLSDEYARLFQRSQATAFQHPLWLDALYRGLARRLRCEPAVVTVRRRDGELILVLPLVRRVRGNLRMIQFADLEVSDYVAPICAPATYAELSGCAEFATRVRTVLRPYDVIRVKKLADAHQPLDRLLGGGQRAAMEVSAHAVALYEPFAQWRADKIDDSYRRELDKKRRKLERKGALRFEKLCEPEAIKAALEVIRAQRRERFPDDRLQEPAYFDFYIDLAVRGAQSGFARTYRMSLDGENIGGAFGVADRGRFLLLLSGAAIGEFKRYSVGALVFEEIARDGLVQGDTVLDFTIGDESYKQLFGAEPSPLWTVSAGASASGKLALVMLDRALWAKRLTAGAGRRARSPAETDS